MDQRRDFSQNFKRRKLDVVREFPDGCGLKNSTMCIDSVGSLLMKSISSSKGKLDSPNGMFSTSFANCKEDSMRTSFSTPSMNDKHNVDVDDVKAVAAHAKMEVLQCRKRKKEALEMFHDILDKDLSKTKSKQRNHTFNASRTAVKVLFERERQVNVPKKLGPIVGVEIGDKFQSRAELVVVGLHHHFMSGIDFVEENGKTLATSIVASGRYDNDLTSCDSLIYCGQGGNPSIGHKQPSDQRLECGNLALINSMEMRNHVRVIYQFKISKSASHFGLSGKKFHNSMYVYDGLYFVDKYWQERGQFGKLVFKFSLKRIDGQPSPIYENAKRKSGKSSNRRGVVSTNDISKGKEKVPIRCINDLDEENLPRFDYITDRILSKSFDASLPLSCDSINGGLEKNGWSSKPIVYECINRESQNGIAFQLEVFRAKSKRWGVRSRSYIRTGSFVCEYVGEVLRDEEVKKRMDSTYRNRLCNMHIFSYSLAGTSGNFTIDATLRGNVGRFVNHCNSPNLQAQCVVYDHDDVKVPHLVLFSVKDIAPNRELTVDYSHTIATFGM